MIAILDSGNAFEFCQLELLFHNCSNPLKKILWDILEDVLEVDFEQRANQLIKHVREKP